MLHSPLLDSVLGHGLRQFNQLIARPSPARERQESYPLYPARFGLGLESLAHRELARQPVATERPRSVHKFSQFRYHVGTFG